jgi:hypothetical protein
MQHRKERMLDQNRRKAAVERIKEFLRAIR